MDVRLEEGTSRCNGRLEVREEGKWFPGLSFMPDWDKRLSDVVCRQLDCGSPFVTKRRSMRQKDEVWRITAPSVGSLL